MTTAKCHSRFSKWKGWGAKKCIWQLSFVHKRNKSQNICIGLKMHKDLLKNVHSDKRLSLFLNNVPGVNYIHPPREKEKQQNFDELNCKLTLITPTAPWKELYLACRGWVPQQQHHNFLPFPFRFYYFRKMGCVCVRTHISSGVGECLNYIMILSVQFI